MNHHPHPVRQISAEGYSIGLLIDLFIRNPYYSEQHEPVNPCVPSPCGPNSQCREVNSHAVCSCQTNYIGVPPNCRPECMISSECAQDKACVNQKCVDPCPGTCGVGAHCMVINHNPICSCSPGFVGDPFVRCLPEESKHVSSPIYTSHFTIFPSLFWYSILFESSAIA